jgi:hypothetical protein
MGNSSKKGFADAVSIISNPLLVVVASLLFISYRYTQDTQQFIRWALVAGTVLVGPAFLYIFYTWYKERRVDIDITRREDRIVPLMLVTLGAVFGSFVVSSRGYHQDLVLISYVLAAMLVSLTVVTVVWKISLHISTLAAFVTLLVVFGGSTFLGLYLMLIPVAWARILLRQHTYAQVVGGGLLGAAITYVASLLFRY